MPGGRGNGIHLQRRQKKQEARALGEHHFLNSKDEIELEAAQGRFDLIISTVNIKLQGDDYIATLAPKGRLHIVGATLERLDSNVLGLISGQRQVSGSPVGSPAIIKQMLNFAALRIIEPVTEAYPFSDINNALDRLREGHAYYRVVLKHEQ